MSSITASIANAQPSPHAKIQATVSQLSNKKNTDAVIEPIKPKEPLQPIRIEEGKGLKIDVSA